MQAVDSSSYFTIDIDVETQTSWPSSRGYTDAASSCASFAYEHGQRNYTQMMSLTLNASTIPAEYTCVVAGQSSGISEYADTSILCSFIFSFSPNE